MSFAVWATNKVASVFDYNVCEVGIVPVMTFKCGAKQLQSSAAHYLRSTPTLAVSPVVCVARAKGCE